MDDKPIGRTDSPATLYVLDVSALFAVLYVSQSIIAKPGCCFSEWPDVSYTFECLVVSLHFEHTFTGLFLFPGRSSGR